MPNILGAPPLLHNQNSPIQLNIFTIIILYFKFRFFDILIFGIIIIYIIVITYTFLKKNIDLIRNMTIFNCIGKFLGSRELQ